jgi:hypothetical protein
LKKKLVRPEMVFPSATDRNAQSAKDSFIEAAAGGQVPDHKMDVVDQTATMKLLNFHADSPFPTGLTSGPQCCSATCHWCPIPNKSRI